MEGPGRAGKSFYATISGEPGKHAKERNYSLDAWAHGDSDWKTEIAVTRIGSGKSTTGDATVVGVDAHAIGDTDHYIVTDITVDGSVTADVGYHGIEHTPVEVTEKESNVVPLVSKIIRVSAKNLHIAPQKWTVKSVRTYEHAAGWNMTTCPGKTNRVIYGRLKNWVVAQTRKFAEGTATE